MKRIVILLAGVLAVAAGAGAQIGKSVSVAAGTPEDRALSEIYAAPDGPEKIALLDKFMADYGQGDMALLGDQLYAQTYLAMKNYPKAYEYGDKALALDPNNLTTAVVLVHAADEQGDAKKVFDAGEKVAAILARYKASPAPEGASAEMWASQKQTTLANAQADIGYAEYAMVNAALKTTQPAARAAFLERFLTDFPDSSYATMVREQTAVAYQAAQNTPKMLAAAQNVLVADPNNISMLLLLSDNWSDKGEQLDKA
ncbi:MAG TPA: tetratricopeptide repeat protein, partial [archaeon]|nr:tetratricopeptide repeat protein [archaeon]